jgi:hypothetical protein
MGSVQTPNPADGQLDPARTAELPVGCHIAKNTSHIIVDYPSNISQKRESYKYKKNNTHSAMQPVGYVLKIKNLTLTGQYQPERVPLTDAS